MKLLTVEDYEKAGESRKDPKYWKNLERIEEGARAEASSQTTLSLSG